MRCVPSASFPASLLLRHVLNSPLCGLGQLPSLVLSHSSHRFCQAAVRRVLRSRERRRADSALVAARRRRADLVWYESPLDVPPSHLKQTRITHAFVSDCIPSPAVVLSCIPDARVAAAHCVVPPWVRCALPALASARAALPLLPAHSSTIAALSHDKIAAAHTSALRASSAGFGGNTMAPSPAAALVRVQRTGVIRGGRLVAISAQSSTDFQKDANEGEPGYMSPFVSALGALRRQWLGQTVRPVGPFSNFPVSHSHVHPKHFIHEATHALIFTPGCGRCDHGSITAQHCAPFSHSQRDARRRLDQQVAISDCRSNTNSGRTIVELSIYDCIGICL